MPLSRAVKMALLLTGGGGDAYLAKLLTIQSANLILLHRMNETSGSVANDSSPEGNDGAYTSVTLNDTTFSNGQPAPLFDAVNDYNDVYSSALNTDFDNAKGTVALWAKMSAAGVWTDGILRSPLSIGADTSNSVRLQKVAASNTLKILHKAGGTNKSVSLGSVSTTDWFHLAMTWDETADEVKGYYNGSQIDATQTALGTWVGALGSSVCLLGAVVIPVSQGWDGWLAYGAIWNVALTAAEILEVATV